MSGSRHSLFISFSSLLPPLPFPSAPSGAPSCKHLLNVPFPSTSLFFPPSLDENCSTTSREEGGYESFPCVLRKDGGNLKLELSSSVKDARRGKGGRRRKESESINFSLQAVAKRSPQLVSLSPPPLYTNEAGNASLAWWWQKAACLLAACSVLFA